MDPSPAELEGVLKLSVSELIHRYPRSVEIILLRRMACVGCTFADFHRVDEALEIYQQDPGTFLQDLSGQIAGNAPPKTRSGSEQEIQDA